MTESIRILILEDNPADAELVQFELKEAGIVFAAKVVMAEEDFIRELQEYCPELILSDYDLPKYTGAMALTEARRRCPDTPFILVTGAVTEDRAIEILTQGAKDYVLKTRLEQRLVPAVRRAMAEAEEHKARQLAEAELRESHRTLEEKVRTRTAELEVEMAERKKTQDALRDSEKRYRRLFESAKDGILILDAATGKIEDVNPFLLQLLGYSYDDLHGKHIWELGVFKDIAASKEAFKTLQDNEYIRYDDLPLETVNGQRIPVEFVSNVYLVDHHKVIQCNIRDVTEQKRMKEEKNRVLNDLQKEKDRLQALVNGINDEIWFADTQKRFTLANPSALHEFALNSHADTIDIQKFAESLEVYRPDGSTRPVEEAPPLRALAGEVVKNQEEMIRTPATGEIRYRQISSNPIKDADGQIIGSVSVVRDITEHKKTDEVLRTSEERFRTMANSIPQLAWIARADGFIFWYNQRWYDYTGTTPEQMEGWGWQSVHDPKVLPEVMERWKTAIATGEPFDMEFPLLGADKVFRPFLTRILPLKNEQGRVTQWFGTNTDLSERKRAEEELALNEREFRLLAESMPQIVWTTRVDGWNTYFNQKWVDYTGLTLEESYGHGWNKPFHPDDQQRAWDAWQNAVLHNAPYLLQCRLRRADGVYRWWLIHGVPVLDENGKIIKWYGTCTDINDLKQTEEAMLQSQDRFNLLIKNIRSVVALIDDTGKFTVVNPSFLRMFGLKNDETINNVNDKNWNDWQVFESDGTLLHVDEHPVRKAAITGKPVKNKLVCVRLPSGGDLIWMLISADLALRPDGSIQSTICTYYDITELKRTEETLKEQATQLEDVNKELESFSYSVSHDLKAPLRAIEGYSRMLLKKDADKLNADTIGKLDIIHSTTEKMNTLIDDLLSFSKVLKSGIAISEINMDKLAREVWAEIQAANTERELEVKITNMLHGKGDPALIRQVLVNLLSNAVKFTKTKRPSIIEVGCYSENGHVVYCIKDNGVGFDMAYYDKLFGVFQRLHSQEEYNGTGIGLAIVHRIIVRHGGKVWAEGEVDKGATFYFTLPKNETKKI